MEALKALYWHVREDVALTSVTLHTVEALVTAAGTLHAAGLMDAGVYAAEMQLYEQIVC
jgi:hypothetical protein